MKGNIQTVLLIALLVTGRINAQSDKLSNAYNCVVRGQLDSAKMIIDQAANEPAMSTDPNTWYIKGFIYKELYKTRELNNKKSPLRMESIAAFKKSLLLDTASQVRTEIIRNIRFLASKFNNDAAESMDTANYKIAIENYEEYKKAMKIADPNWNSTTADIEFGKVIGGVYSQLSEKGNNTNKEKYFMLAKESFLKTLSIDSADISANYSLGRLYYNRAAQIVLDMQYEELEVLDSIQTQMVTFLKQALPYMERAYRLIRKKGDEYSKDTRILDVLEALSNINIALHEDKRAQEYKAEKKTIEDQK